MTQPPKRILDEEELQNFVSEAIWDSCTAEDTAYGLPKVVGQEKATAIIVSRFKQDIQRAVAEARIDHIMKDFLAYSMELDGDMEIAKAIRDSMLSVVQAQLTKQSEEK